LGQPGPEAVEERQLRLSELLPTVDSAPESAVIASIKDVFDGGLFRANSVIHDCFSGRQSVRDFVPGLFHV